VLLIDSEGLQEPTPVSLLHRGWDATELHAEGLVADDEYAAKRKTILDEL
jgi:hypothetical protein